MNLRRPTIWIWLCTCLVACGPTFGTADQPKKDSGSPTPAVDTRTTDPGAVDSRPISENAASDAGTPAQADAGQDSSPSAIDAGGPDVSAPDAPELPTDAAPGLDVRADLAKPTDATVDTAPAVDNRAPEIDSRPREIDTRPADVMPDVPADVPTPVDTRPADVVNPGTGLLAYYPCESNAGGLLIDQSGNAHSATLMSPVSFVAGVSGNAVVLGKSQTTDAGTQKGYVALPANLFASMTDMTMALWIRMRSNANWNRVFDFGSSTSVYMFLTPNQMNSKLRFAISVTGNGSGEQQMDGPALALNTWYHVAIVLDATGGHIFVNGTEAGSNSGMTLRPADLGATPNSWLGRSQFTADPYFDGDVDEIRLYSRALSASEIQALATP